MFKTLIGKNGFLFLINDACKELEVHNNNLCLVNENFYHKYEKYKGKTLLIVFPNKSYVYSQFLPDNYNLKYRSGYDIYKQYFNENIIDGYNILKNNDDVYYKTDTHINTKGALLIYSIFIDKINELFNLNIINKTYTLIKKNCESLSKLNLGLGDLTWDTNLGNQLLENINDTHYIIDDFPQLYMIYIFDKDSSIRLLKNIDNNIIDYTNDNINKLLEWNIISDYILFKKNENIDNKNKVIIFYDSFLCSTLHLYMNLFYEIYFIKDIYNTDIINLINPDYIFEFRCERFLF